MTQPTQIYFGPDGGFKPEDAPPKIYLRTLLFSTANRGHVIENMFLRVHRGETRQNFNIWVFGDEKLSRGSGLFVPKAGVAANHHFLLPFDGALFSFSPGLYSLELFATVVGGRAARSLFSGSVEVTPDHSRQLHQKGYGLYFDWGPDAGRFFAHIRPTPKTDLPASIRDTLVSGRD
ncbi:hypothetical protein [Bradyrhizobium sp. SZCCHNR3118]|uniref:hypothetical protein n=1 Tax=Bradyrhizobium sp. SZCCHNR3118 TaxID=3057468 RepID=UPI00291621A4|nr:hypothetical protein [Bradyrhizobium sp. SZCCHNR3118]